MASTKRSGTPLNLMDDDETYKDFFADSKDFLNQHKHLLKCTSCKSNLFTSVKLGKIFVHPLLQVIVCEKCYDFYTCGEFSQDEDGYDKYCRWCGNGGLLYLCSKCPYGFCKKCYKTNLPKQLKDLENDDWKCIVCNNDPLKKLQAFVHAVKKSSSTNKRPSRTSKRSRKISASESDAESVKNKVKDSLGSKKKKKNLIQIDSDKESNDKIILESADKEFKEKSKKLLILNLQNMIDTMELGLKKCKQLLDQTKKSEFEKVPKILKYYQNVDKLNTNLIETMQNTITPGINSLHQQFLKRSNKNVKSEKETTENSDSSQNELNKKSIKEDSKLKKEKDDIIEVNKPINPFDDEDEDELFPKRSPVDINFDSLLENITNDDEENDINETKNKNDEKNILKNKVKIESSDSEESNNKNKKRKRSHSYDNIRKKGKHSDNDDDDNNDDKDASNNKQKGRSLDDNAEAQENKGNKEMDADSENKEMDADTDNQQKDADGDNKEMDADTDNQQKDADGDNKEMDTDTDNQEMDADTDNQENDADTDIQEKDADSVKRDDDRDLKKSDANDNESDISEINESFLESTTSKIKNDDKDSNKKKKIKKKPAPIGDSSDSDTTYERLCNIKSLLKEKTKKILNQTDNEDDMNNDSNDIFEKEITNNKNKKRVNRAMSSSDSENTNKSIPELHEDYNDLNLEDFKELNNTMKSEMMKFIEENFEDDDELKEEVNNEKKYNKSKRSKEKVDDKNTKWKNHPLLRGKISDSDSEIEFVKWNKHKDRKSDDQKERQQQRHRQRLQLISSDEENDHAILISSTSSSEQEQFENNKSDSDQSKKKTKKMKRIKRVESSNSSSEDEDDKEALDTPQKKRKNIKKIIKDTETADSTKQAAKDEEERQKRIEERQKLFYELMKQTEVETNENVILDIDPETKEPLVKVHPKIAIKLKPHQIQGIQFMFNSVIESVKQVENNSKGNGCILAHCMGLGKTLQVVALVHTLLTNPRCKIRTAMIVCPLSTVHNWTQEFLMWTKPCEGNVIELFDLTRDKKNYERMYRLKDWQETGGVLIIGYNLLRTIANCKTGVKKSIRDSFSSCLLDPGADLVVCDEGHLLKNEKSALSQTMCKVNTKRRIILTGTPLQNNLIEYHCMVSFVKPNLLGTRKEFQNRFVNPITNGQFADSNTHDLRVMKRRAHVLHKMLENSVQRFDYSVLTPFLPPKFEFAVLIKLSERQIKMYQHFLDFFATQPGSGTKSSLFADFQGLQRISTHPRVLQLKQERYEREKARRMTDSEEESAGSLNEFIDDNSSDSNSTSSNEEGSVSSNDDVQSIDSNDKKKKKKRRPKTRNFRKENTDVSSDEDKENKDKISKEWWESYIENQDIMNDINESGKLVILFEILKECELIGDKVLIFSQSLFSLDLIEYFLECIDQQTLDKKLIRGYNGTWIKGADYFRLDGQTLSEVRHAHCKHFNDPHNNRARLFLISTRAGGLGINLTSANRVIIFDASWNPSYDMQSIFRIYRFGQIKPCFIYRFLAQGTMEEKVYDRQVTKLSLSCRVVDEQQIERHFNMSDLSELYKFEPSIHITRSHGPPKDKLLADLMIEFPQWILDYHEHDTLLQNKEDEELNEEERKAAWQDYENEKKGNIANPNPNLAIYQHYFNASINKLIQQFPNKTYQEIQSLAQRISAAQAQAHLEQVYQMNHLQQQANASARELFQQTHAQLLKNFKYNTLLNNVPGSSSNLNTKYPDSSVEIHDID